MSMHVCRLSVGCHWIQFCAFVNMTMMWWKVANGKVKNYGWVVYAKIKLFSSHFLVVIRHENI
jgi:hypothetical protein